MNVFLKRHLDRHTDVCKGHMYKYIYVWPFEIIFSELLTKLFFS